MDTQEQKSTDVGDLYPHTGFQRTPVRPSRAYMYVCLYVWKSVSLSLCLSVKSSALIFWWSYVRPVIARITFFSSHRVKSPEWHYNISIFPFIWSSEDLFRFLYLYYFPVWGSSTVMYISLHRGPKKPSGFQSSLFLFLSVRIYVSLSGCPRHFVTIKSHVL